MSKWERIVVDALAVAFLLTAGWQLGSTTSGHEYAYYQTLRLVAFFAWVFAAFRFYAYRWIPIAVISALVALAFNPLLPLMMRKGQWQPYDRVAMVASFGAAIALAWLSYRESRV
jgi:hypothetical protein